MRKYTDIAVLAGGKSLSVTYDYVENSDLGQTCVITAEGKTLIIDEDFAIVRNDMPDEWVQPVISTLKNMLRKRSS